MNEYDGYKQCEFCGGYDYPGATYKRKGITYTDTSMVCDGIRTLGSNPFDEEIRGDYTEYLECEGSRYQSAMDI